MCYWKTKKKIICWHFLIDCTCKKGTGFQDTLSFMTSDGPNCKSRSCSLFDFICLRLKMTLFLCFLFLNLTITFSFFFIRWQAWRSSSVTVVPVKESTWHTLFSKSVLGIDWGIWLISMVSLRTYWVLFRALRSKLIICFSRRKLQFVKINCSEFNLSYSNWIHYSDHWAYQ